MSELSFDQLLDRVYEQLEKNGQLSKKRRKVQIPIAPTFNRKDLRTICTNFPAFCDALNRPPEMLAKYINDEMTVSSSILGSGELSIVGYHDPARLMSVIRKFVESRIQCPECNSGKTVIEKESGFLKLNCSVCRASSPLE